MGKIIYTENIGFDMSDWESENIKKVYAGTDCIMALTTDGRVLQKVTDSEVAARTKFWNNITDIAVSGCLPGMAIGLVSDGTCMISKRPIRRYCDGNGISRQFDRINDAVKSWKDIVEVEASDAFFALDKHGRVHYVNLSNDYDDYSATKSWENVVHIAVGTQNSVFGITADGRVLCTGGNLAGSIRRESRKSFFKDIEGAVDVCTSGSECERIYVAYKDGAVRVLTEDKVYYGCKNSAGVLEGKFNGALIHKADGCLEIEPYGFWGGDYSVLDGVPVSSFAIGDINYGPLFAIAVKE